VQQLIGCRPGGVASGRLEGRRLEPESVRASVRAYVPVFMPVFVPLAGTCERVRRVMDHPHHPLRRCGTRMQCHPAVLLWMLCGTPHRPQTGDKGLSAATSLGWLAACHNACWRAVLPRPQVYACSPTGGAAWAWPQLTGVMVMAVQPLMCMGGGLDCTGRGRLLPRSKCCVCCVCPVWLSYLRGWFPVRILIRDHSVTTAAVGE
jgi:hypothetical protein